MNREAAARGIKQGPFTYDDLLNMPDDRNRYEVIEGELAATPSPNTPHQWIVIELLAVHVRHVSGHALGRVFTAPYDIVFDAHNVAEPDILFVAKERIAEVIREEHAVAAPDLVIEVLSPSTAPRDRVTKRRTYERFGVRHYWIVDPKKKTLEEFCLDGETYRAGAALRGDETFRPRIFPELEIDLAKLWPPKFRKDRRRRQG